MSPAWFPVLFMLSWLAILLLVVRHPADRVQASAAATGLGPAATGLAAARLAQRPAGARGLVFRGGVERRGGAGRQRTSLRPSRLRVIRLESGLLSFTPDGAAAPVWTVPCDQLVADRRSYFSLDGGDVQLSGPMGVVRCAVSTEHINRFSTNTAKDLRERRYAAQFVALLHAHGARPSAVADPYS